MWGVRVVLEMEFELVLQRTYAQAIKNVLSQRGEWCWNISKLHLECDKVHLAETAGIKQDSLLQCSEHNKMVQEV